MQNGVTLITRSTTNKVITIMTIAKDFASKFAVAFVAAAMILTAIAPAVQAAEADDLQTTINDLLAQVADLQGQLGDDEADTTSASCESVPAPLTMGSQGASVTALQNRLIADGQAIAAGATGYFGAQTKAALAGWQAAHNVAPAVGYYGPLTMAAMDAACVPADEDEDTDEDDSDDEDSGDLSGEGSLDKFEIDDANDTDVQEGMEDAEIAELTLEATDGDIQITRMDIALTNVDGTDDAWDVFETISLWVDGEMVGDIDSSDEDNFLDEDDGTLRFTGLDIVLMEDEELEVIIGGSVVGSVDDTMPNTWSVEVNEVRYFDADGVATDDDSTGDIEPFDDTAPVAEFDIVEAGDGEELKFSLGDNNPDATDIVVDEDDSTDGVTILEYTIEAQEGDIELNTLFANIVITNDTYAAVVDDIYLVVDGEEFDDEGLVGAADANGSTTVEFDIDGDITIDEDSEVTVEVVVDLKKMTGNYDNGDQIQARVRSDETDATDAEGMDDVDEFSGTATGETHTLVATGIIVPVDSVETVADASGDNDTTGEFEITFEVTAVEGDFYINDYASRNGSTTLGGVEFDVEASGAGVATGISGTLSSTADEGTAGAFHIPEGETEEFTLNVTFTASTAGQFRVVLKEVWYATADDGNPGTLYTPTPAQDFRTTYKQVNVAS